MAIHVASAATPSLKTRWRVLDQQAQSYSGATTYTVVATLTATAGAALIPLRVIGQILGTISTNGDMKFRFTYEDDQTYDTANGIAGSTAQTFALGAFDTTPTATAESGGAWAGSPSNVRSVRADVAGVVDNTRGVKKIEVLVKRSNTTNAVTWTAHISALEVYA